MDENKIHFASMPSLFKRSFPSRLDAVTHDVAQNDLQPDSFQLI
jgi:hypothetical protein